ncbi:MAG: RluA family pseudouridine synthase [Treponema sp.]|nr:RluA family pseudouridine synthase [Treponema sp.]
MILELKTGSNDAGRRLDRILRKALPEHSLSLIHRLLRQGKVLVNEKTAKQDDRIPGDSVIKIKLNETVNHSKLLVNNNSYSTREMPEILWQESGIMVLNKPPGIAAHGKDSLDEIVNGYLSGKLPRSVSFRPGPLHRLDKGTSGAIAFSLTLEGARHFSRLLQERKIRKTYLAVVEGQIIKEAQWKNELARDKKMQKTLILDGKSTDKAKTAITSVKAVAYDNGYTLIEARIETGRTHQIRAQAAANGAPLAGDVKYGGRPVSGSSGRDGFFLHAWKMEFEGNLITAPPPESFVSLVSALFGQKAKGKITR